MVRLEDGRYIIGFDNGYQFGKTARSLFDNGVHAMGKVEPSVMEHTLKHRRGGSTRSAREGPPSRRTRSPTRTRGC